MQKVSRPQGRWRNVVFGCVGLLVILVDQLSKTWIRANLVRGQSLFDTGFFRVVNAQNTGAVFGIFKDHTSTLIIVAFVGIIAILLLVFVLQSRWSFLDNLLVMSAVGLVVGGTIGNQIDRLRLGYVTDFIDFRVWPAFNVADAATTVGVIIIAYHLIFLAQPAKNRE
jgi:signal peptidase II